jgi:hypothetical protein
MLFVVIITYLLLFISKFPTTNALYIYIGNTTTETVVTKYSMPSYYSTLGTYPTQSIEYNITVVSSKFIDGCDLNPLNSSAGTIKDRVVVFSGTIPMFRPCCTDPHAATSTLAKLAQQLGALGLIVEQPDQVCITIAFCLLSVTLRE